MHAFMHACIHACFHACMHMDDICDNNTTLETVSLLHSEQNIPTPNSIRGTNTFLSVFHYKYQHIDRNNEVFSQINDYNSVHEICFTRLYLSIEL
jgi:hypothetical protein